MLSQIAGWYLNCLRTGLEWKSTGKKNINLTADIIWHSSSMVKYLVYMSSIKKLIPSCWNPRDNQVPLYFLSVLQHNFSPLKPQCSGAGRLALSESCSGATDSTLAFFPLSCLSWCSHTVEILQVIFPPLYNNIDYRKLLANFLKLTPLI